MYIRHRVYISDEYKQLYMRKKMFHFRKSLYENIIIITLAKNVWDLKIKKNT